LSDRAIRHFDELNAQNRAQRLQQAAGIEGRALGGIARDQIEAQRLAETTGIITNFKLGTIAAQKAAQQDEGRLNPDFDERYMAGFIQRRDEVMAAAPEWQRAGLQAAFTEMEANERIRLMTEGFALREEQIRNTAAQGLEGILNLVHEDPTQFPQALTDARKSLDGLPLNIRQAMSADMPGRLMVSMASGYLARSDHDGLKALMHNPDTQKLMPVKEYDYYSGMVSKVEVSAERAMEREVVSVDYANELTLLATTGQGAGFDPNRFIKAYGPVEGPVMAQRAVREMGEAKEDYSRINEAIRLKRSDYMDRAPEMPDLGDPDYAEKVMRRERYIAQGAAIFEARDKDPARFVAEGRDTRSAWDAYASGQHGGAKRWADTVYNRQVAWGMDDNSIRILPDNVAKKMVQTVLKAPDDQRDEALAGLWGQVTGFGEQHSGRVLKELQRAGLPLPDAALLNAVNGDPVTLGHYTRAQGVAKRTKLPSADQLALHGAINRVFGDYIGSWSYNSEGQGFGDNLKQAAYIMAQGFKADGLSDKDAAREAGRLIIDRHYVVSDHGGYRIPVHISDRRVSVATVLVDGSQGAEVMSGDRAVNQAAYQIIRDVVINPSQLDTQGSEPHLTKAQKQQRYAHQIANGGYWVTTDDDRGLMMVLRDPRSGTQAVLGADGKPIIRTWDQLEARVAPSSVRGK